MVTVLKRLYVNNAIKHTAPSQIIIQFVEEIENYIITDEDDGVGFDVTKAKDNNSAGLINIQTRIGFLKGTFHLQSQSQVGTSVEISFSKINVCDKDHNHR
ncbi:MAG: hypothetical protein ACTJHT_13730 [Sphingobacterium sp.]